MTPREYFDIARERWRFIVAGLLLGLATAGVVTWIMPPQYSVPVTVIVATQPGADAATSPSDQDISAQRIQTYVELMRSRRLAGDVIEELRLAASPEELAARITVTTSPDSVLLTATITDGDPGQAVRIANAVADQFIGNVAEIEQPADPDRPPPVAAKVFEAAAPPAELVAPRPLLYVLLGAALGLAVGLAAALARHGLDSRIKSRRQLEDILRVPVLGAIGRDPQITKSPLVMYGAPHTPQAEAFRQLRTNVSFTGVDREHKVILVTSATSGEGRSTTVTNLGLALAEAGSRVLILDADLRDPAIARYLSVDDTLGLTDVLVNRIPFERAVQPIGPTLDLLPSGLLPPNPSELLGSNRMVNLLAMLRKRYDVVLIDSAPLLPVTDAAVLAPRVDGVLLVVRHGRTVVQDVQAAKDALDAVSGRVVGSVMTMVSYAGTRAHARLKPRKGNRQAPARPPLVPPAVPGRKEGSTTSAGGDPKTLQLIAPPPAQRLPVPNGRTAMRTASPAAAPPAQEATASEAREEATVPGALETTALEAREEATVPGALDAGAPGALEAAVAPGATPQPSPRPRPQKASADANGQALDRGSSAAP